jgi:hypothetical protein
MTTTMSRDVGHEGAAVLEAPDVALQLDRVSKSFGQKRVLDEVSFAVDKGSGVVILERNRQERHAQDDHRSGPAGQRPRTGGRRRRVRDDP